MTRFKRKKCVKCDKEFWEYKLSDDGLCEKCTARKEKQKELAQKRREKKGKKDD